MQEVTKIEPSQSQSSNRSNSYEYSAESSVKRVQNRKINVCLVQKDIFSFKIRPEAQNSKY